MYEKIQDENFVIIAAAQDTGGEAVARPWYDQAKATYVTLVDEAHAISALYDLVNVPSAVWIDEAGLVRRVDEGTYATTHNLGGFEFGRNDYAPMIVDWVANGEGSEYLLSAEEIAQKLTPPTDDANLAEPTFKLGVYFHQKGDQTKANHYWEAAQRLNPDSWNYHRQDWSFTPDEAGANWQKKVQTLSKPYYEPIKGLDSP